MKLNSVQHVKFGVLSTVLVLATIMLTTIDVTQTSVFAQNTTSTLLPPHLPAQDGTSTPTTPVLESSGSNDDDESSSTPTTPALVSSGSNDDESSSSDDSNNSNGDETSSPSGFDGTTSITPAPDTGSSRSGDDDDSGSQDTPSSDDDDSGSQDTSSSEEEEDETEDDSEQTNPLLGQIRDRVNGALSASGMPSP